MSEPIQHQDHMRMMVTKDKRITELEAKVERLEKLLAIAKCPDSYCDGKGTCAAGDPTDPSNVELWQCQWCDERKEALDKGD